MITEEANYRVKHSVVNLIFGFAIGAIFGHFCTSHLILSFLAQRRRARTATSGGKRRDGSLGSSYG
jgi:hypothetical protein